MKGATAPVVRHGPMAHIVKKNGRFVAALTEGGREFLSKYLYKYPHPISFVTSTMYRAYIQALASGATDEEINQAAFRGFLNAAIRYQPDSGHKFSTFAWWHVRNQVQRLASKSQRRLALEPLDHDVEARPTKDAIHHADDREQIRTVMRRLDPEYRRVVELRYGLCDGKERSLIEVARRVRKSKEWCRQIERRALRAMRSVMGDA